MSDEKLLIDGEITRGKKAKQILEEPLFVESVQTVRTELMNEWLNSDEKNSEQRENIWKMRRMLEVVLIQLQSVMETGKLAKQKQSENN
tara:strand:- start:615 stop:881 length:267 start_codon:yes stop_codon:yes gene_type:complete